MKIIATLAALMLCTACFAQTATEKANNDKKVVRINCAAHKTADDIVIVVDGIVKDKTTLQSINPNDISRINIIKGKEAITLYGDKAKDGAIIITTKCPALKPAAAI